MLKLLGLKSGDIFYDLGSGDGGLLIKAVKDYNVKAIGIEINPFLVFWSRIKIRKLGLGQRVKIYWGNFFKRDFSDADAITVYLLRRTTNQLEKKLLSKLKPGTKIVSLSFTFKNIPFIAADLENPNIRLYQIP